MLHDEHVRDPFCNLGRDEEEGKREEEKERGRGGRGERESGSKGGQCTSTCIPVCT